MTTPATVMTPQLADVVAELKRGPRTTRQLMRATGSLRVGALVHVLRLMGYNIHTEIIRVPTRHRRPASVAKYTLRRNRRRVAK